MSGGYFTVALNFADYFDGATRWLEVEVRPGASTGNYTPLTPRTSLTGVPFTLGLRPGATVNTTTTDVPALRASTRQTPTPTPWSPPAMARAMP